MKMNLGDNIIRADRRQFMDCINGDLMIRDKDGVITHLGDAASEAVEKAENGEKVILQVNGKDYSYILDQTEYLINE